MGAKSEIPFSLRPLVDAASAAINSIKLNAVSKGHHRGRPQRVKTRRTGSEQIAGLANLFFSGANAHITVSATPKDWQRREIGCYRMLNGDRYRAFADGPQTVRQDTLPGKSLRDLLLSRKLTPRALEAGAKEIRRAHRLRSSEFGGRQWSHGDLHMGNVIYDETTDRARLIDFEITHDKSLSTVTRHADDLLVFLQDMVDAIREREWLPSALHFLKSYGRPHVVARLRTMLTVPKGMAGFWWTIRSNFCDRAKMLRRFRALRHALDARVQGKVVMGRHGNTSQHHAPRHHRGLGRQRNGSYETE